MISYDNYKNRIEKLAKAKRIIHKFRFLIMGVLTLIIAVSVGLMLAKGSYMSATVLSAQNIDFNQPYEVTPAKAFLDSVRSQKIEYCAADDNGNANGEWTTEKPVKSGKYFARTVSPKLVGYSYSGAVSFVINRLDAAFEISGESVVYGNVPQCTTTGLVSGHRVDTQALEFNYADYGAASTQVDVVESSFKIVDADGEDFTCCYNVTFSGKELTVANRDLTVKPTDKTVVYDGKAQTFAQTIEESNLAKGDEIVYETAIINNGMRVREVTDAGEYTVEFTSVKIMHGSTDVTARYNLNELTALLKIEKRKISVTTESQSKVYDGKPLRNGGFMSVNLAEGHSIHVGNLPEITNVGTRKNDFTVTVLDSASRDVTANYEAPAFTYGTLEVKPCEVTVKTVSDTQIYSGTPLINYGFALDGAPASGFRFVAVENSTARITDFGTVKNVFEVSVINEESGIPVTENFKLTYEYGTLKIDKRPVTITTGSATRVFNNQPLSNGGYEVTGGTLVSGQQPAVDVLFSVTDVTASGGIDNTTTFRVLDGIKDVSGNYTITYVYGKLIVNVRRIVVYTTDGGRIFDGNVFSDSSYRTAWEEDESEVGLLTGELTTVSAAEITHFGTVKNECSYTLADSNYEIAKYVYGTLEILARPITVVTKSDSKVYDGTALTAPEYIHTYLAGDSTQPGLIGDDKLTLVEGSAPSILDFGAIDNNSLFTVPNSDYEIVDYNLGVISILQRHIIVTTATDKKEYDGNPLENTDYTTVWADDITKVGLIGDDKLTVYSKQTIFEVGGPVPNSCSYRVPSSNYVIDDTVFGTLTITPRPIMVVTADASKPYDGDPLSKTDGFKVYYAVEEDGEWKAVTDGSEAGLIGDDQLIITHIVEITDFGTTPNACLYTHENDYGCSNYDVHYTFGTLEITARKIVVVTASASKVFDGEPLSAGTYAGTYLYGDPAKAGLLGEDALTLISGSAPSITNFGSVANDCKFTVPDNNYEIVGYDNGTLEITQRHITVTTASDSKVYDGSALSNSGYVTAWVNDGTQTGLIGSDKLTVTGNPSVTDVDKIENKAESYTLPEFEAGKTNYVIDGIVYGWLEVTVRTLSITTGSATKVYDGIALTQTAFEKCVYIDANGEEFNGLVLDHQLKAIEGTVTSQTNATDEVGVDNTTEYEVVDGKGNPVKNNYKIEYVAYGKLIIERAALNIIALFYSDIADRPALTYGDTFEYEKGIGNYRLATGLVNGEQLEIAVLVYADLDLTTQVTPKNAGSYYFGVDTENCVVYDKEGNVIENGINNYSISKFNSTHYCGLLVINTKTINVTISDQSCEYGEDIPANDFVIYDTDGTTVIANGSLPYNETLSLDYAYSQGESAVEKPKNAGEYTIGATASIDGDTAGVSNYTINFTDGALTIEKRKLEINFVKETLEFGLEPYEYYSLIDIDLPYAEILQIKVKYVRNGEEYKIGDRFNVGEYEVIPVLFNVYDGNFSDDKLIDSGLANALKNYDITCGNGIFEVTAKEITIKIDDAECTYGDALPALSYNIYDSNGKEYTLPYGDNDLFSVYHKYFDADGNEVNPPKNAGEYTIAYDGALINLSEDGLENYVINSEDGTLTIKSKHITVYVGEQSDDGIINSYTAVYGDALPEIKYFHSDLVAGDSLTADVDFGIHGSSGIEFGITPKNAGTYVVNFKRVCINGEEIPLAYEGEKYYNYYLAVVAGSLEITPRDITVELNPVESVVYGSTFVYAAAIGNYANTPDLAYGDQLKVAVKYYDKDGNECTPKNAGTYFVDIDDANCEFYDKEGVKIESDYKNYNIKVSLDTLSCTIVPKKLNVKVDDAFAQYGEYLAYYDDRDFTITDENGVVIAKNSLPYGDVLTLTYKILQDGKDLNINNEIFRLDAGEYEAAMKSAAINGGAEGLANYDITYSSGTITVAKTPIEIDLNGLVNLTYVYGQSIPNIFVLSDDTLTEGIMPFLEAIKFEFEYLKDGVYYKRGDKFNVGSYKFVITNCIVYDSASDNANQIDSGLPEQLKNYEIEFVDCFLDVIPKDITVTVGNAEITYGENLPEITFEITDVDGQKIENGSLPYGETLSIIFKYTDGSGNAVAVPQNVGVYNVTIEEKEITDGKLSNYNITAVDGTLEIIPLEIGVDFINPECVYGEEIPTELTLKGIYSLTFTNLGVGMMPTVLPYGDKLSFAFAYGSTDDNNINSHWFGDPGYDINNPVTPRNAGIYAMVITDILVNGEACVNYKIFIDVPLLVINPRDITVELNPIANVTYGETFAYGTGKGNYTGAPDLAYGELLQIAVKFIDGNGNVVNPKNAGVYSAKIDENNCVFYNADGTVIDGGLNNYTVYCQALENLKINKKSLFIKIDSQGQNGEIVYGDDLPQNTFTIYSSIACDNEIANGDLPYNETLDFVFEYLLKREVVTPKDAGSDYIITFDPTNLSNILIDGAPCEYDNYTFGIFTGKLAISKKTLDITLTDKFTLVYGDAEHLNLLGELNDLVSEPYFATNAGDDITLGYGERLIIVVDYLDKDGISVTPKNAGEYVMRAASFAILSADGDKNYVISNYVINCNDGLLTITPKKITVVFDDKECIYGDDLPAITAQITEGLDENGRLPYGEDYIIEGYYVDGLGNLLSRPDVGEYEIKFDCLFDREQLIEAGDNYDVTAVSGTLTVSARNLRVNVTDMTVDYGESIGEIVYGIELLDKDGAVLQNNLHYNESLSLTFRFTQNGEMVVAPRNVGDYAIEIDGKAVTGGNGSADNYNIILNGGKLTISPKQITVEIYSDSCVYGEEIPHNKFVICDGLDENGKLPYGENIDFVYSYEKDGVSTRDPKAAGVYTVSVAAVNVDNGGSDGNYRIGYIGSPVLEIKTKQITVALNGGVAPAPFAYGDDFNASICNAEVEGLLDGQILKVAVVYSQAAQTASRRAGVRSASAFAVNFSSRESFIPRNVGAYIAELDWDNCQLFESDGVTPVEGGMDNYAFAPGNECKPVSFTIDKKQITVTVNNSSSVYGDVLPLETIDYVLSEALPYGEELSLTFAITDEEGNVAKNVGSYAITVVGKDIDGGSIDNYDVIFADNSPSHEITARKINVTLTNQFVTFGDAPAYPDTIGNYDNIDNLADGENIRVAVRYVLNGVTVDNPVQAGIYDIEVVSFEVYGANDQLITDGFKNYEIVSVTGTLEISSRVITVKSGDAEKKYDGKALTSDDYDILSGALADGYTIAVKEYFEQVHATGEDGVENKTTFVVLYNGEETDNYVVSCTQYGTFKVTPRPVAIVTDSAERDYNGEALTAGYTLSYNGEGEDKALGEGDTLSILSTNSIIDAGSVKNSLTYVITNAKNEDVTALDYVITYTEGTLTVNVLDVAVTISDVSAQYGEKFDVSFTLDCGSLPNGEQLGFEVVYKTRTGVVTPEITDEYFILARGSYVIAADETTVTVDGSAEKVDNYNFDFGNTGTLTVSRREITVITVTATKTYDGDPLTNGRYDTVWAKDANYQGLVGSDGLEYSGELPSVTECGVTVENRILYTASDNYTIIERKYGTLSIDQRSITVQTGDINEEYDGTLFSNDNGLVTGGVALVDGHRLVPVDVYERSEATEDGSEKNTTTFKVMSGNTDVTKNYNIGYENGTVIIRRRAITVQTADISATYDGTAHYDGSYGWVGEVRPVLDHQLVVAQLFTWTNATVSGSKQNTTTYSVKGADGDKTANYNITVVPGSVDIAQAKITVTLGDATAVYGDAAYGVKLSNNATVTGLAKGESLRLAFVYSDGDKLPNAGTYTATLDWENCSVIYGGSVKTGGLDNYELVNLPDGATLTIGKKSITVTVNAAERVYGDSLALDAITYTLSDSLGYNDSLALTFEVKDGAGFAAKNVGEYDITVVSKSVTGGYASLDNYDLEVISNTLTIKAKKIDITLDSFTFGYSDKVVYPDGPENYKSLTPSTAYGERIEVEVAYERNGVETEPKYAGEYTIVLKGVKVYLADGTTEVEGGAANYDYSGFISGKLTVEGINLVVTRKTVTKTYDGNALSLSATATADEVSYYYVDADGVTHTQLGDGYSLMLKQPYATASANVQTVENSAEYVVWYNGAPSGEFIVTYDTDNNGKLVIEARKIVVVTADAGKVYNGVALTKTDGYKTYLYGDSSSAGLLGGDVLTVVTAASLLNAGTAENDTEYAVPEFAAGLSNYVIADCEYGTLTVSKRQIVITTATDSHVYDGTYFSNASYKTVWADDGVSNGLIGNDELTLIGTAPSIKDIGSITNECNFKLPEFEAGKSNYEIYGSVNYGTLTVTVRKIVVITSDATKVYDGTALSNVNYDGTYLSGDKTQSGLIGGDSLTADASAVIPYIINAGRVENDCKFVAPNSNYEIAGYDKGALTVTPKSLTVTLGMDKESYVYGDESVKNYTVNSEGLVGGDKLEVKLVYKLNGVTVNQPKAAGAYTAEIDKLLSVCTTDNGTDIKNAIGNYDITCNVLGFDIVRKSITVVLGAWADEEYNGKAHTFGGSCSVVEGLEYGEEISALGFDFYTDAAKANSVNAPVNAGRYYVYLNAAGTSLDNLDALSDNYDVTCESIEFNVTKKALSIAVSNNIGYVYDGNAFDFAKVDGFTATGLVNGEKLDLTVDYEQNGKECTPVNAGTYGVLVKDVAVAGDENGINNYDIISCTDGSLEITRREIKLTIKDKTAENGKEAYGADDVLVTGDGFVGNDFESAIANGEITFTYTDKLPVPEGASSQYTVSVEVTEGEIMSNYSVTGVTDGTLRVTERYVHVSPEYLGSGRLVYNGEAVSSDLFGFSHTHGIDGASDEDDAYGFKPEDLPNITAVYTFTNEADGTTSTSFPVNAGTYTFTVKLTGEGTKNYLIDYIGGPASFTIERRTVDLTITNNGANSFVYNGKMPDIEAEFKVINAESTDGFINGDGADIEIALTDGERVGKFSAAGSYSLAVMFGNIENYDLTVYNVTDLSIEIVKRDILVLPAQPAGGVEQYYEGHDLGLAADEYEIVLGDGVYDLVEGDVLTIETNKITPSMRKGWVQIQSVTVTSGGVDVTANYNAHYLYSISDSIIIKFNIKQSQMRLSMSFKTFDVHYNQEIDGKNFSYTGAAQTYDISGTSAENAVSIVSSNANGGSATLYAGHRFEFSTTNVAVSANAGVYAGWLANVLKVYDANGNDVTPLYSFVCDNANDEGKPIVVSKNELVITLNGVTAEALDNGETNGLFVPSPVDGILTLNPANYTVSGLLEADGVAVHSVEIAVFNIRDKWLLGVVVYRKNNTSRVDVSANYEFADVEHDAGFDVQLIQVSDLKTLAKPLLEVSIDVTAADIINGYGTAYAPTGIFGTMQLTGGYSVYGLQAGHGLGIFVFRSGDSYMLGVSIYRDLGGGRYSDARTQYNLAALPAIDGLTVEYINVDNIKLYTRELYIDFTNSFTENADGTVSANLNGDGTLVHEAFGLYTGDETAITVTENADGTFTLTIKVTTGKGVDRTKYYLPVGITSTLPAGVTVNLQTTV